jgi:hypothetical protein
MQTDRCTQTVQAKTKGWPYYDKYGCSRCKALAPDAGQAAAAAQAAGQDPEQAALAAMQKNNPNLQKLMAKNKQPVNISGKKKAAAPQQQVASKENLGNMVAESFSIFRKH